MPKLTDRNVIIRASILRRQGNTLDDVMSGLRAEFPLGLVPDRSTISRRLKDNPLEELAEDIPFRWGTMTDIPWEYSRLIFDIWALYESIARHAAGPFTARTAKWCFRIFQGMDSEYKWEDSDSTPGTEIPTYGDVIGVAIEYAWREIAAIVLSETFDTDDLDLLLAFTPWRSGDHCQRYQELKYPDGWLAVSKHSPILWHLGNLTWLEDVIPELARDLRKKGIGSEVSQLGPNKSDNVSLLIEAGTKAIDGLLPSQIGRYRRVRFDESTDEVLKSSDREPWYFDHLDKVASMGWASTPKSKGDNHEGFN